MCIQVVAICQGEKEVLETVPNKKDFKKRKKEWQKRLGPDWEIRKG